MLSIEVGGLDGTEKKLGSVGVSEIIEKLHVEL